MRYLKCRKNVKEFKKAMEKDLLGIHYILKDYIESEEFERTMKEIACKEVSEISELIERRFIQMDSVTKSALILGIVNYKRDAYSYKYAFIQLKQTEDKLLEKAAMIIICSLFGTAALMLQAWSVTESSLFLIGGFAILLLLVAPRFMSKSERITKSSGSKVNEKMYLKQKLSTLKYDVSIVESEIKHAAYKYWNTSMILGCRHRS